MRIGRVQVEGETFLARFEDSDAAVLLHKESDHPAADALREALSNDVDLMAAGRSVDRREYTLLSPVRNPTKYFGVGMNYREHALEGGFEVPDKPIFFVKTPNVIIGPQDTIRVRTSTTAQPDFEVELVIVIGHRVSGELSPASARDAILGYTVGNDVTARDAQFSDGQWPRAKSYDTFGPLGPWIVTTDEFDPSSVRLWSTVSGDLMQDGNTSELVFGPEELVSYLARAITLEPGDLITTGTPSGVGFARNPPRFLMDGDVVEVGVEGIGSIENTVRVTR